MQVSIKDDLSKLTTINKLHIDRLFDKINWCISDYVEKAIISNDNMLDIDFGFGVLTLEIGENSVKYRFKPSQALEKSVINTIINDKNELELVVEKNLVQKITNIYKEMF